MATSRICSEPNQLRNIAIVHNTTVQIWQEIKPTKFSDHCILATSVFMVKTVGSSKWQYKFTKLHGVTAQKSVPKR